MSSAPSVMIVEDEAIIARDLKEILEGAGFRVAAVVTSEQQAIETVISTAVDLALVDIRIPSEEEGGDLAGIRLAEELWTCDHIPVVFVTAFPQLVTRACASNTGAFGVVAKPFTQDGVIAQAWIAIQRCNQLKTVQAATLK